MQFFNELASQWSTVLQVLMVLSLTTLVVSQIRSKNNKFSMVEIVLSAILVGVCIYLGGLAILQVMLVLSIVTFILTQFKSKKFSTQEIAMASMLMAVSIVLTRVASIMIPIGGYSALRLGFGPIPIILASIMLGPILGAMVGAGADLIGMMIAAHGAFSPYIFLAQTLYGVIPFFALYLFKNRTTLSYSIAAIVTQLICGTITAYGLTFLMNRPFGELLVMRAPAQLIIMVGYSVIIGLMHSHIFRVQKLTHIGASR